MNQSEKEKIFNLNLSYLKIDTDPPIELRLPVETDIFLKPFGVYIKYNSSSNLKNLYSLNFEISNVVNGPDKPSADKIATGENGFRLTLMKLNK